MLGISEKLVKIGNEFVGWEKLCADLECFLNPVP